MLLYMVMDGRSESPKPQARGTLVRDVVTPVREAPVAASVIRPQSQPQPVPEPQVVSKPPVEKEEKKPHNDSPKVQKASVSHTPKPPAPVLAILATVTIVLGLGAMITYTYLRTQNIAVF